MRFVLLGPIGIVCESGSVPIGGRRMQTVLGIMLVYRNTHVSMERIIDEMWPVNPPPSAVHNIRTYIHQLRRRLGQVCSTSSLETIAGGYRLNVSEDELDVNDYLRLSRMAHEEMEAGSPQRAVGYFTESLELWQGTPMAGLEIGRATEAHLRALEEHRWRTEIAHVEARLCLGDASYAASTVARLLGERPFDEKLWELRMRALTQSGRRTDALMTYTDVRRTLRNELGVEPSASLQDLHHSILREDDHFGRPPNEVELHSYGQTLSSRCGDRTSTDYSDLSHHVKESTRLR